MNNEITLIIDGNPVDFVRKDSIPASTQISEESGAWQVGKPYLIRTVTMTLHGTLVAVTPSELVLRDAAWIADSGRFANFLKGEEPNEVEPFPDGDVLVGRGSVIDAFQKDGSFRVQK